jgi:hypothetical protein
MRNRGVTVACFTTLLRNSSQGNAMTVENLRSIVIPPISFEPGIPVIEVTSVNRCVKLFNGPVCNSFIPITQDSPWVTGYTYTPLQFEWSSYARVNLLYVLWTRIYSGPEDQRERDWFCCYTWNMQCLINVHVCVCVQASTRRRTWSAPTQCALRQVTDMK